MNVSVTVWVELGFDIEASYSPGRPATPPSYSSGGDPPEPAEYDIEDLSDIVFEHRKYNAQTERWDKEKIGLFKHMTPEEVAVVKKALIAAIHASELDNQFFEAVQEEANT